MGEHKRNRNRRRPNKARAVIRAIVMFTFGAPSGGQQIGEDALERLVGRSHLVQPDAAAELGARKAANLAATGADAVAAGNPGCSIQIAAHLDVPIYHPMTLLDHSIRGSRP